MAGQPKTRAKRAAEAAKSPVEAGGSRPPARARPPAATKPKPRKKAGSSGGKKSKRGPGRPRFEPANLADYETYGKALERAQATAEKKGKLTARDRVERDEAIVAAWALGMTPATIGEQWGLAPGHVREIIVAHRERRAAQPIPSSSELLADTLEAVEALIERTSLLASTAKTEAVKLGAVRTVMELLESRAGLWQVMGLVTSRPSDAARAERARDMLRKLLDVLRELDVPQEKIDAAARRVLEPGIGDDGTVTVIEGRASVVSR